jgi:hypothetical protein
LIFEEKSQIGRHLYFLEAIFQKKELQKVNKTKLTISQKAYFLFFAIFSMNMRASNFVKIRKFFTGFQNG